MNGNRKGSASAKAESKAIDWQELLQRAKALDAPLSDEELALWRRGIIDGNARMWNVDYVHAVQRAVEGHDRAQLDAMLMAAIPVPSFLLPFLAQKVCGRRPLAFTAMEDQINADMYRRAVEHLGMSSAEAKRWLAGSRNCHVRTIERSLKRIAGRD